MTRARDACRETANPRASRVVGWQPCNILRTMVVKQNKGESSYTCVCVCVDCVVLFELIRSTGYIVKRTWGTDLFRPKEAGGRPCDELSRYHEISWTGCLCMFKNSRPRDDTPRPHHERPSEFSNLHRNTLFGYTCLWMYRETSRELYRSGKAKKYVFFSVFSRKKCDFTFRAKWIWQLKMIMPSKYFILFQFFLHLKNWYCFIYIAQEGYLESR